MPIKRNEFLNPSNGFEAAYKAGEELVLKVLRESPGDFYPASEIQQLATKSLPLNFGGILGSAAISLVIQEVLPKLAASNRVEHQERGGLHYYASVN